MRKGAAAHFSVTQTHGISFAFAISVCDLSTEHDVLVCLSFQGWSYFLLHI